MNVLTAIDGILKRRWCSQTMLVKWSDNLTHWSLVAHIGVRKINHHWSRKWLVVCSAPNHYLNQCWNIVDLNLRNELPWNLERNSYISLQMHLKMLSAKWRQFCFVLNVKGTLRMRHIIKQHSKFTIFSKISSSILNDNIFLMKCYTKPLIAWVSLLQKWMTYLCVKMYF